MNKFVTTTIKRVMKQELDREVNVKTRHYGEGKSSELCHIRERDCDPLLSWIIFHRICEMYRSAVILKNKYILKLVHS